MPKNLTNKPKLRLVQIVDPNIEVNLAYATENNFTGQVLYDDKCAYLRPEAAEALSKVASALAALDVRIVLLDAFRPISVQHKLWAFRPDPEFVADPKIGSDHSRGIAVDVTLANSSGWLDMGTDFDAAVPQSHHDRFDIPKRAVENRNILRETMVNAGFEANPLEWWHYALAGGKNFPVIEDRHLEPDAA
jgi:D-alanyl-D-alanine dipeptidase